MGHCTMLGTPTATPAQAAVAALQTAPATTTASPTARASYACTNAPGRYAKVRSAIAVCPTLGHAGEGRGLVLAGVGLDLAEAQLIDPIPNQRHR